MRLFFNRSREVESNLHIYEEGHPEIEVNLLFRDYLRRHSNARDEYSKLKEDLLKEKSSYEKNNSQFTGYSLGKDVVNQELVDSCNCEDSGSRDKAKKERIQSGQQIANRKARKGTKNQSYKFQLR